MISIDLDLNRYHLPSTPKLFLGSSTPLCTRCVLNIDLNVGETRGFAAEHTRTGASTLREERTKASKFQIPLDPGAAPGFVDAGGRGWKTGDHAAAATEVFGVFAVEEVVDPADEAAVGV